MMYVFFCPDTQTWEENLNDVFLIAKSMQYVANLSGFGGNQEGGFNLVCLIMPNLFMNQYQVRQSLHLARDKKIPSQFLHYLWVHHPLHCIRNLLLLPCSHHHRLQKKVLLQRARKQNRYANDLIAHAISFNVNIF